MILSTSWMSLRFSARGSLTSMAITFQSVSPSSIMAKTPRTFTLRTVPLKTKKVFFSPGSFHRPTYLGWIKNLPGVDGWTNFADVDRIVVSLAVGGWIGVVGVLPGLHGHVHDKYKYVQKYKSTYMTTSNAMKKSSSPEEWPHSSRCTHGVGNSLLHICKRGWTITIIGIIAFG